MTYPPETPSPSYGSSPATGYPPPEVPPTYAEGASSYPGEVPPSDYGNGSDSWPTGVDRDQPSQVGGTAAQAGQQVAEIAKEQATNVADHAKTEAKNLLRQTRDEVSSQAGNQQQRAAGGLRSLGSELQSMASKSDSDGPAAQAAREAADRINTAAGWLENRDPGQVLTEIQGFARRRPGAFLALAAVAGLAAGRLTRGLAADGSSESTQAGNAPGGLGAEPVSTFSDVGQPEYGWPAASDPNDPAGYGAPMSAPPGFEAPAPPAQAPAPPAGVRPQDSLPPVSEGTYPDPGTGGMQR